MNKFSIGDRVMLKGGSEAMTVLFVEAYEVTCGWLENGKERKALYNEQQLEKIISWEDAADI